MVWNDCYLTTEQVIEQIIGLNSSLECQWRNSYGWASNEAARLLEESRLDWLVSLSHTLKIWVTDAVPTEQNDGRLILAWANLGSLVEGSMKFFLSVYAQTYKDDVTSNQGQSIFKKLWDCRKGAAREPDELMLDLLREFFRLRIWQLTDKRNWDSWVAHIRDRRNAVHAYADRDLGNWAEFGEDIRIYLEFLYYVSLSLPDPPDHGVFE